MNYAYRRMIPDCRSPVPILSHVPSNGQVEAAGIAVVILCGFEVMGDPPLLAQDVQGGQRGVPHKPELLRVGERTWEIFNGKTSDK